MECTEQSIYNYSQKVEECSWESSLKEVMGSIEESSQVMECMEQSIQLESEGGDGVLCVNNYALCVYNTCTKIGHMLSIILYILALSI